MDKEMNKGNTSNYTLIEKYPHLKQKVIYIIKKIKCSRNGKIKIQLTLKKLVFFLSANSPDMDGYFLVGGVAAKRISLAHCKFCNMKILIKGN